MNQQTHEKPYEQRTKREQLIERCAFWLAEFHKGEYRQRRLLALATERKVTGNAQASAYLDRLKADLAEGRDLSLNRLYAAIATRTAEMLIGRKPGKGV